MDPEFADQLTETLAILLYMNDQPKGDGFVRGWLHELEEDRESYREMARGEKPLPNNG